MQSPGALVKVSNLLPEKFLILQTFSGNSSCNVHSWGWGLGSGFIKLPLVRSVLPDKTLNKEGNGEGEEGRWERRGNRVGEEMENV